MMSFRYREKGTAVHRLNALCKLAWIISLSASALMLNHPICLFLLFLSTLPLVVAAKVWRQWSSFMRLSLYLCIGIIVINTLVSYNGLHVLWRAPFRIPVLGVPTITLEALFFGVGMSLRLLTIISAFTILTLTIHPGDILQAMLKIKVPYKSVLVTSLSTRFVPTLIDDVGRISDVQRSRGLELDRGSWFQRIKSRTAIIIPLLSNSLDRTVQVAEAMESRAFGSGQKRTFYKGLKLNRIDTITLALTFLPLVLAALMHLWGMGDYQYYPVLGRMGLDRLGWEMVVLLLLLVEMILPLALLKKRLELD